MLYSLMRSKINHTASLLFFLCVSFLIYPCYGMNEFIFMNSFKSPLNENGKKLVAVTVSRAHQYPNPDRIDVYSSLNEKEIDVYSSLNEKEVALVYACASLMVGGDQEKVNEHMLKNMSSLKVHFNLLDRFMHEYDKSYMFADMFAKYLNTRENYINNDKIFDTCKYTEAFNDFAERLQQKNNYQYIDNIRNAIKIIAFHEMFFSFYVVPKSYVDIVTQHLEPTFDDKTLIYLNFVYIGLCHHKSEHESIEAYKAYMRQELICADYQYLPVKDQYLEDFKDGDCCAFNRSGFFYKGFRLSYYDKRSYFFEGDNFIKNTWAKYVRYHYGDGKDHLSKQLRFYQSSTQVTALQNFIINNISTETCFDLANSVRNNNQWTNNDTENNLLHTRKIHLIASNFIYSFFNSDNFKNLPMDRLVVHADPRVFSECVFGINKDGVELCDALHNNNLFYNGLQNSLSVVNNSPVLSLYLKINDKIFVFCLYDIADSFNRFYRGY